VHSSVVVSAKLVLLFLGPFSEWLGDISARVLAANHETDLT